MITNEFDPQRRAIINPEDHIKPVEGLPPLCVGIFSHRTVEHLVARFGGVQVSQCHCCTGDIPLYRLTAYGAGLTLFLPMVGGPGAAGFIEELIPKGGRYFVFCGAAGVLDSQIAHGKLLLPTAAVRDEGLSYHYLPPADEVALDPLCVDACRQALTGLGFPFAEGKTWTTDAFYRETQAKLARRKAQGCISVEMECASLAAVAQFRGVPFAQFFWATDTLDGDGWDKGILSGKGAGLEEVCLQAAVETGKRLAASANRQV
ncbi:nucleoside phosphorylase [Acutalibacter caecimuris]|uniref:nucleoside phosphorylase n=1 Tax=Acutalibacter caecimuris TaxID=3093657 RepID=UPI002AC919F0|nr:nucleoside phosphorylase [Acutalibacter sp. M00118]